MKKWQSIGACYINISGRSFDQNDFTEFTLNTLDKHKISADKLCFEMTETAAVSNLSNIYNFMTELRKRGSSFTLDNFGSGLASFSYLKQIPVEYLKIDGAFIKNLTRDPIDYAMVKAIRNIGRAPGKGMIAVCVENQESHDLLNKMGIEFLQSYYRTCNK
jgi:EAL domain-containing protein (putative c-di-GMP-specific phosphodiesterase class I)